MERTSCCAEGAGDGSCGSSPDKLNGFEILVGGPAGSIGGGKNALVCANDVME